MLNNTPESGIQAAGRSPRLRLTAVFNHGARKPGLVAGWGFSCLVEGPEKTILFDTGADGAVLLENLRSIDRLKALAVEKVAPSHCTGEEATALFRRAWGQDFLEAGLGEIITLYLRQQSGP